MTPLPGAKQQAADESFGDGVMRNVTPTAFVVTVILRGFVGGAQRNEQTRSDELPQQRRFGRRTLAIVGGISAPEVSVFSVKGSSTPLLGDGGQILQVTL